MSVALPHRSRDNTSASPDPSNEVTMRDRANSALSDVLMSDPLNDADTPSTDPSSYSDDMQEDLTNSTDLEDVQPAEPRIDKAIANSGFFRFPREIRERIYLHLLHAPYAVLWPAAHLNSGLHVSILRACNAIYHEAAPMLYGTNMLHFQHPSDSNMFLWAHNPALSRQVSKILLQIRDRDVRGMWTNYLGSTSVTRSLLNDYPGLQSLHIQLRSSFLAALNGDLAERFKRWTGDRALRELCLSLEGRTPEGCDVRVLVCTRLINEDVRLLIEQFPEELGRVKGADDGHMGRLVLRTGWQAIFRAYVALEIEGGLGEGSRVMGP